MLAVNLRISDASTVGRLKFQHVGTFCFAVLNLASMLRALLLGASSLWLCHAMPNTTGKICQWGCYDEEDEACHAGLANMACAEIYGHLVIVNACDIVAFPGLNHFSA